MNEPLKPVLTAQEAAQQLGISMPTMYQLIRRDDFPALHIGRSIRISRQGLEEWVYRQATDKAGAV